MFKRSFAFLVALSTACLVPAFAGNGDPPASAGRTTNFVSLSSSMEPGECLWSYLVPFPTRTDDRTDNPADAGDWELGIADAYAHTIANGMQVWGYCWAKDTTGSTTTAGAAISAASLGGFTVTAANMPDECSASIAAWWQPRTRLRAHVKRGLGSVTVGSMQHGQILELEMNVLNALDFNVTSNSVVTSSGSSINIAGLGGVGQTISSITSISTAPREQTILQNAFARKGISSCTVSYIGNTWVSVNADRLRGKSIAEAEGWIWDSVPGLEVEARCLLPCKGKISVHYGWGM